MNPFDFLFNELMEQEKSLLYLINIAQSKCELLEQEDLMIYLDKIYEDLKGSPCLVVIEKNQEDIEEKDYLENITHVKTPSVLKDSHFDKDIRNLMNEDLSIEKNPSFCIYLKLDNSKGDDILNDNCVDQSLSSESLSSFEIFNNNHIVLDTLDKHDLIIKDSATSEVHHEILSLKVTYEIPSRNDEINLNESLSFEPKLDEPLNEKECDLFFYPQELLLDQYVIHLEKNLRNLEGLFVKESI